jgi:hypothetical protein
VKPKPLDEVGVWKIMFKIIQEINWIIDFGGLLSRRKTISARKPLFLWIFLSLRPVAVA